MCNANSITLNKYQNIIQLIEKKNNNSEEKLKKKILCTAAVCGCVPQSFPEFHPLQLINNAFHLSFIFIFQNDKLFITLHTYPNAFENGFQHHTRII